ncbi:hypothetical protein [Glutamicibacter halophytocola]|uniref:hypothetical protein n=1 Tax=Glutamicibacter halophytocola TaxID=1933880 RepID=UPI0015C5643A|nr:hypothetical protein [Glutamicibacter halophytocola]NQD42439.1 hypothetical protein [Glutamicibacter halophytocola]
MTSKPNPRPFARAKIGPWTNPQTGNAIIGICILGNRGLAAHLSTGGARALADQLHDLADELETSTAAKPPKATEVPCARPRLTAADGTEEPLLLTSPAESE